jgi:hypothetical protein
MGVKRFMLILKGNDSPFIFKYKLDKLNTYAMLSNFSEEHLRTILDSIMDNGFIKTEYISQYDGSNLKLLFFYKLHMLFGISLSDISTFVIIGLLR